MRQPVGSNIPILGVLFGGAGDELAVGELSVRAGVAQAAASREVARLEQHGLVKTRALGRNRLVRPNWSLPWAPELRSILLQTVGVLGRLGEALSGLEGVDEAFVFGSWAARFEGEPGSYPKGVIPDSAKPQARAFSSGAPSDGITAGQRPNGRSRGHYSV